jgi:N4-gp56 family major capsid protein
MPILRFEQFAVKKTELGVQPGLTIKFMRYHNLGNASQLVEGVRMQTHALSAEQYDISVYEHGYAVAVSELLLNASFDDVMASASRLLGRNMAIYLDGTSRDTLYLGTSVKFGYTLPTSRGTRAPYEPGVPAIQAGRDATTAANGLYSGSGLFSAHLVKDGVQTLASKNVPRLGETYVCFVHPFQSRQLRDDPEWIEVTKYAAPGNFMLGEIGRINDVVFIETTQVDDIKMDYEGKLFGAAGYNTGGLAGTYVPIDIYRAILVGDNAFGHAISLPVELRDGGILDFGREHALAWYAIWGLGLITDQAIVQLWTKPYSSQAPVDFGYEAVGGVPVTLPGAVINV